MPALEDALHLITTIISWLAELCGALVVGIAVILASVRLARVTLQPSSTSMTPEMIRIDLGRALALGLEFLLAADIVSTAVSPTWEEIGRLAAIATIRTGLNYFLERELRSAQRNPGE